MFWPWAANLELKPPLFTPRPEVQNFHWLINLNNHRLIVAYGGGGVITFLYIPKEGHHFFSFDKGGIMCFWRCFAGSYRTCPPPLR